MNLNLQFCFCLIYEWMTSNNFASSLFTTFFKCFSSFHSFAIIMSVSVFSPFLFISLHFTSFLFISLICNNHVCFFTSLFLRSFSILVMKVRKGFRYIWVWIMKWIRRQYWKIFLKRRNCVSFHDTSNYSPCFSPSFLPLLSLSLFSLLLVVTNMLLSSLDVFLILIPLPFILFRQLFSASLPFSILFPSTFSPLLIQL